MKTCKECAHFFVSSTLREEFCLAIVPLWASSANNNTTAETNADECECFTEDGSDE